MGVYERKCRNELTYRIILNYKKKNSFVNVHL